MSQRHGMMSASNEKAKNLSKTLSTLLKYLKPFRIAIVFVIIFAVGQVPSISMVLNTHYFYYFVYTYSLAFFLTFKHG